MQFKSLAEAEAFLAAKSAQWRSGSPCPKCGRTLSPWPLRRGKEPRCSPTGWVNCIAKYPLEESPT